MSSFLAGTPERLAQEMRICAQGSNHRGDELMPWEVEAA